MIVRYFDFKHVAVMPFKADPPLVVDANAVLARTVTAGYLKMIGGRRAQIFQCDRTIEHAQLPESHLLNVVRQLTRESAPKYLLCFLAPE